MSGGCPFELFWASEMTHNAKAFNLIEVSIYLALLSFIFYTSFTIFTALLLHTQRLTVGVMRDCMAFTAMQLIRTDLLQTHAACIVQDNNLILNNKSLVWLYDAQHKRVWRTALGKKGRDHALILERVERWRLGSAEKQGGVHLIDLAFTHVGKPFKTRLYANMQENS